MSSPTRPSRRRANCRRKQAYANAAEAMRAIEEVERAGKLGSPDAAPYLCDICGWYHWGHKVEARPK